VRLKVGALAFEVEVFLILGGLADFRSCDLPFFNPGEGFKEPLSLCSPPFYGHSRIKITWAHWAIEVMEWSGRQRKSFCAGFYHRVNRSKIKLSIPDRDSSGF
jgi:hypothetical protein